MRSLLLSILSILLCSAGEAQLKADFTVNKEGGCAPLIVTFTNTSTGTTASASYEWNFDNGNLSTLKHASAIFSEEKTFRVTLTVREGSQSSVKTMDIRVYKKPTVDFSISTSKGCLPLPVTLTANASTTDGSISSYFWDFGDGYTQETGSNTIAHTYQHEQDPQINLTVTTSNGCQQTITKQDLVKVLPRLTAEFSAKKDVLCKITDAAAFVNSSTGPGTLSYTWDFGDGQTSTDKEPAVTFKSIGTYTIKLTSRSSEGCITVNEKAAYINAANFKTNFKQPALICEKTYAPFENTSTPTPQLSIWEYNNGQKDYSMYAPYIYFNTPGPNQFMLVNKFGECYDTLKTTIQVGPKPGLTGFVAELLDSCGPPARVHFKDTSAGNVSWTWGPMVPYYYTGINTTTNNHIYTYTQTGYFYPTLEVTNSAGCRTTAYAQVNVLNPAVTISDTYYKQHYRTSFCGPITTTFSATHNQSEIVSYEWDFGDGTKSTEATPTKTYDKEGQFLVKLTFKLKNGCIATQQYDQYFTIENRRKIDLNFPQTTICGNTPAYFDAINPSGNRYIYYNWSYSKDGGDFRDLYYWQNGFYKFQEEGTYTIRLIASNMVCADTIVKTNYVKVLPPFPKITLVENTCEGDRGLVTISQESKLTNSWTWDFGDGTPARTLTTHQDTVKHHYTQTGYYKVKLTNVNGACTVTDSLYAPVLMKQKPTLKLSQSEICATGSVRFFVDNLDQNPKPGYYYHYGYSTWPIEYGDGTLFDGWSDSYTQLEKLPFTNNLSKLNPNKKDLRIITRSDYFNCTDTTNFAVLKIKGPVASFTAENSQQCEQNYGIDLKDASIGTGNVPIVNWKWDYGNGQVSNRTNGNPFTYNYAGPIYTYIKLTVTDKDGCSSEANQLVYPLNTSVTAKISASATVVSPNSTVYFFNQSTSSETWNTSYRWILGNGTESNDANSVSETFTQPGWYTITLIATNKVRGCADTTSVQVQVKYINAAFNLDPAKISVGKCLPVVVKFTNKSFNISRINWDFGDGTTATNVLNPSHVYTQPGKYIVVANAYSDNNTLYQTIDSVFIGIPAPTIQADILEACTAQSITLSGKTEKGSTYTWDLGDGTVVSTNDSFYVHRFKHAGVFNARLLQTDAAGCSVSAKMDQPIVIDSLSIALRNIPAKICSPKDLLFDPYIYSVAADRNNRQLDYHWNFGTGMAADTSDLRNASFRYTQPGTYTVSLQVASPAGCSKSASAVINVFEGLGGRIEGPTEICEQGSAQFTAKTILPGSPTYTWIFEDGSSSNSAVTASRKYGSPGAFPILLLVDNNGCVDSIQTTLQVRAKPIVSMSANTAVLCEGKTLKVQAGGGTGYSWSPAAGIDDPAAAVVNISTRNNSTYTVTVTNDYGCSKQDSIKIRVAKPFDLSYQGLFTVCRGASVQLNANGAATYQWINNTQGLNRADVKDPLASPLQDMQYTLVGTDADKCFTDTANIQVTVLPLPTVNVGPDVELLVGAPFQLQSSYSSDVVGWKWDPARHLSCDNCPAPQLTPMEPIDYKLTVRSSNGCIATDTISVKLLCSESRIYIPNAFTPDRNGKNDRFVISGYGIKIVKYLRIYNRWGNIVFERTNFRFDDVNASWDGTYNGKKVDSGTYIYVTEMSCNEQSFIKRGAINVIN